MIEIPMRDLLILKVLIAYGIVGSTAAILLYSLVIGGNSQLQVDLNFSKVQFNFQVYCPVNSQQTLKFYKNSFGSNMKLIQNANLQSLYIVFMEIKSLKDADIKTDEMRNYQQKGSQMHYCGLARQWNGTCKNATLICSSPGPMFYMPIQQSTTIIWVNNIKKQRLQYWIQQGCYNGHQNDPQCKMDAKFKYNSNLQSCTFNEPTNYGYPHRKVFVNKSIIPVAPYIHGLQIRPAFSGNPLSWFNNNQEVGVGFFSLSHSKYFDQFKRIEFNSISLTNKNFPIRIIKVNNRQMPGVLQYYDNSIKVAKQNVAAGLSGLYILVNQSAQSILPQNQEQKFIYFSHLLKFASLSKQNNEFNQKNTKDQIYILNQQNDIYHRNLTYRFRIINGHINNHYQNISFAIFSTGSDNQGLDNSFQVDPQTISYHLEFYMKFINFTVIASGSALFNKPVYKVRSVDLGISQRLQILIQFDETNGISKNLKHFYLVVFNPNTKKYDIKKKFTISRYYKPNKYQGINQIKSISVPYISLAQKGRQYTQVNRMIFCWTHHDQNFSVINGNYQMNQGKTQKSKIGTIQNWYLINNNQKPYPFHIGFLNFQLVQSYSLKRTIQGCTFYELDYFRMSRSPFFINITNKDLCYYIRNMTIQDSKLIFDELQKQDIQSRISNNFLGKVIGLNVMQYITKLSDQQEYGELSNNHPCNLKHLYKYICDQSFSSIPQWNKRWKDATNVQENTVFVIKIRLASTIYQQKSEQFSYFSIPEQQIIQFPGFFYQGLTLQGKDSQNIRPFMLQFSAAYLQDKLPSNIHLISTFNTDSFLWQPKAMNINKNIQCLN